MDISAIVKSYKRGKLAIPDNRDNTRTYIIKREGIDMLYKQETDAAQREERKCSLNTMWCIWVLAKSYKKSNTV